MRCALFTPLSLYPFHLSLPLSLSLSPSLPPTLLSLPPSLYLSFYLSFSLFPSLSLLFIILFGVSNGRLRPCLLHKCNLSLNNHTIMICPDSLTTSLFGTHYLSYPINLVHRSLHTQFLSIKSALKAFPPTLLDAR